MKDSTLKQPNEQPLYQEFCSSAKRGFLVAGSVNKKRLERYIPRPLLTPQNKLLFILNVISPTGATYQLSSLNLSRT